MSQGERWEGKVREVLDRHLTHTGEHRCECNTCANCGEPWGEPFDRERHADCAMTLRELQAFIEEQ